MTRLRVAELLHEAIFRVIRRAPPLPPVDEFLELPIRGLLPGSSPAQWSSFWKEALVASLETVFRREGYRIDELSPRVFLRWNRKMRSLRDWIAERVMPLSDSTDGRVRFPALILMLALLLPALPLLPIAGGPAPAASPETAARLSGSTAILERTPADRPERARYAHDVLVAFRGPTGRRIELPYEAITNRGHYEMRSDCTPDGPVSIEKILWRGAGEAPGRATGAVIYADLEPECTYRLFLTLPGHAPAEIAVAAGEEALAGPAGGFVRLVRFVDRHLSGTLDVRTLEEEDDRIGIDFQAQFDFPVLRRRLLADAIRCRLNATGMLAVDRRAHQAHNALDLELAASWLRLYTLPSPRWARRHVHALGFQLSPAGFESDQDFRVIDYTFGPAVTFSVPLLDWPLLLWHSAIEMPRGFLPPTVRVGYTYLHRVRPSGPAPDDRRRLDVEVVFLAPLLRPLDLQARYRWYKDLEEDEHEEILELSWNWYVDRDTRTAVLLKLVHGALPPTFRQAQMVGVGFTVGL
jgi:hypothetical protein